MRRLRCVSPGTCCAHSCLELRAHLLLRSLRRLEQHDLIVLDDVAGEERRVVGDELLRRKRLDLPQQIDRHALRPRHQLIVEEVIDDAGRGLPSHAALLRTTRLPLLSRPGTLT